MNRNNDAGQPIGGAPRAPTSGADTSDERAQACSSSDHTGTARQRFERLLRLPEVKMRTGLSRSTIYGKIANARFPPPKKLGAKMVGWYQSDVDAWIADPR